MCKGRPWCLMSYTHCKGWWGQVTIFWCWRKQLYFFNWKTSCLTFFLPSLKRSWTLSGYSYPSRPPLSSVATCMTICLSPHSHCLLLSISFWFPFSKCLSRNENFLPPSATVNWHLIIWHLISTAMEFNPVRSINLF